MKRKCLLLFAGCLLLTSCGGVSATKNLTDNAGKAIACYGEAASLEPLYEFSYNFFQGNMNEENPIMSPISAYYAMSLAASGAEGETKAEMEAVLGEYYYQICDETMEKLSKKSSDITISLANSAWIDDGFKADKDWLLDINTYFDSEVFQTNLSTDAAMKDINQWCSDKTNGLIPHFLSQPLPESTRFALFNALYFNSKWRDPFYTTATREEPFYLEDGKETTVDMMRSFSDYNYYFEDENLQGVCLPYYDDKVFVALMPTGETTVRELYNSLTMEELSTFAKTETRTSINLKLPKFEANCSLQLIDYFKTQGIEASFDPYLADFSRMGKTTSGNPVYISEIRQEAVIKVNEEGTEAGAVTMVAAAEGAMEPQESVDVFFDKPFFYMIYDKITDIPLFMGIFEKP